jgi:hypothetical protein
MDESNGDSTAVAETDKLAQLVAHAAATLAKATTATEVFDTCKQAKFAYDAAKLAIRFSKNPTFAAYRKAMADALMIGVQAQCLLVDKYDAAQERGELRKAGKPNFSHAEN